ncbi:MAG: YlxR family protein [Candidatus Gastranaerophilales bacterium]|nr:YlxR family protein [Candidatus Gastranaerophilales bacterium]
MIERKCHACNLKQDRTLMIKITKLPAGLKINPSSKELGRSIYVCKNIECIKKLIKKKRIKTALKYNNFEEIERIEQELLRSV